MSNSYELYFKQYTPIDYDCYKCKVFIGRIDQCETCLKFYEHHKIPFKNRERWI